MKARQYFNYVLSYSGSHRCVVLNALDYWADGVGSIPSVIWCFSGRSPLAKYWQTKERCSTSLNSRSKFALNCRRVREPLQSYRGYMQRRRLLSTLVFFQQWVWHTMEKSHFLNKYCLHSCTVQLKYIPFQYQISETVNKQSKIFLLDPKYAFM